MALLRAALASILVESSTRQGGRFLDHYEGQLRAAEDDGIAFHLFQPLQDLDQPPELL